MGFVMVEVDITPEDQCKAIEMSGHRVYDRSMRGKEANLVGAYGELVVMNYLQALGLEPVLEHKTTHDIRVNNLTIDVKTKERAVVPEPHYDCTVPAYNHDHQRPDFFIFVSLLAHQKTGCRRFRKAFILGKIGYNRLTSEARHWRKGEIDPSNNWKATIDCFNIQVDQLEPMKPLPYEYEMSILDRLRRENEQRNKQALSIENA